MLRSFRWNTAAVCAAFLFCGLLHVVTFGRPYADLVSQVFCGAFCIVWGISVRYRVTDRLIRKLLTAIALSFLLYLSAQAVNYRFAQDVPVIRRYAWYGYYVAMMICAVLFYLTAFVCRRDPKRKISWYYRLPPAVCILVTAGFLTNDLHGLAFRFTGQEKLPGSPRVNGLLYYLFYAMIFALLVLAFVILCRRNRAMRRDRAPVIPVLLPLIVMLTVLIPDMAGKGLSINGIKLWQTGETYCFCIIAFLEIHIALGIVPANTDYERLFTETGLSAVILDDSGTVRAASAGIAYPFAEDGNTLVKQHPIPGGEVRWAVDVAPLRALNLEMEETNQKITTRNAYLASEAAVKKEKAEKETRNRIYDEITRIVRPQLDRIREQMDAREGSFDVRLRDISVYCAYIKRRSNMELLAESGLLPLEELALAVSESMDYVRLKGIPAAASTVGTGTYPAAMIIALYEQMEAVTEDCLESLKALMVTVRAAEKEIVMRMMIRAESVTVPEAGRSGPGFATAVSAVKEGQDMILVFTCREGGAAP